ncbi:helix-turn-helix transcriptional regulator [Reyranella soli]|uniref:DNA-binding protein n=1 Tax=Reyranella soli TaxID=1230389 RepID=A0A512N8N8_9HYPH|nr:DNA-binding protein [Reyranella soli]
MGVIRIQEVMVKSKLSRSTIYSLCIQGLFPPPRKIGVRAVGWIESEVDHWMEARPTALPTRRSAGAEPKEKQ